MSGLRVEVLWLDEHLVELRVRADNGRFAAVADCYDGHSVFSAIADAVRGFPQSPSDRREIELGTFEPRGAGGGARLSFTSDHLGHVTLRVTLQTSTNARHAEDRERRPSSFPSNLRRSTRSPRNSRACRWRSSPLRSFLVRSGPDARRPVALDIVSETDQNTMRVQWCWRCRMDIPMLDEVERGESNHHALYHRVQGDSRRA